MKVLHLKNPAKVAWNLAQAQQRLGLETEVVMTSKTGWHQLYDCDLSDHDTTTLRGKAALGRDLYRLVKDCDLLHYHGTPVSSGYRDLLFWAKVMGKPVFLHHHGTDVRWKPYPPLASKLSRHRFVSTPDLLPWVPQAECVLNPIDLTILPFTHPSKEKPLRVVHAPSKRAIKNTHAVISAVEKLRKRGIKLEFQLLEEIQHKELIETIKQAHIVVDWVNPDYGIYGVLSVEAMALGRPVVCTLNPEFYSELNSPIVNCAPDNLATTLENLLYDSDLCLRLGRLGRRYVLTHHHPLNAAAQVIKAYKKWL